MTTEPVAGLLARQEIHDVVLRYCRGVDRLDLDLVRDCYHPGALDHHTGFDGTVAEYVPWVQAAGAGIVSDVAKQPIVEAIEW